jgi:hypothetical protein
MKINRTLWKMPVPATGLIHGPDLKQLPEHKCEISFSIESEAGDEKWCKLHFDGVEAFKCTYLKSLGSIDRSLRRQSYGSVILVDESTWLEGVQKSYLDYCASAHIAPIELQHLMISFDDGPSYEFICVSFKAI